MYKIYTQKKDKGLIMSFLRTKFEPCNKIWRPPCLSELIQIFNMELTH